MDMLSVWYGFYHRLYIFSPRLTCSVESPTSDFSTFRKNKMINLSSKNFNMARKAKQEPSCSYETEDDNNNDDVSDNDENDDENEDEGDNDDEDDNDEDNDNDNDNSAVQCTDVRKDCCYSKKCGKPDLRPRTQ